ncbi:MAG TPA: IS21-like element helper ATPase IstB [Acidimicrobiales bacterium]|nr:IS21-like element helper ATPase IstB [Acidimicrobiales bacterium]
MLAEQTIDKLEALGLAAMAAGLSEQLSAPGTYDGLSFADRLGLLVDKEADARDSRRLATRLKAAKLRHPASIEDIDFRAPRGLDRSVVLSLAQGPWVREHHNVLVTGPTGCGKSFLACALANSAVRLGHTALYVRTPRLLDDLALGRADGRYARLLSQLARVGVLVLDDFLLTPASVEACRDLLEVVEDRAGVRSTVVASQVPVDKWHPSMADPTLADAVVDRLFQASHRIVMKGASMRKRQPAPSP